ncbi:MAG: VOC family protein [Cyanobacteria bacterium]|nr:VOC family protein [Cyanobacteriota bacterium]
MKTRVHINLPVSNLEQSIAFYSKLFNTPPSKVKSDYANFRLEEPALHLALVLQADYTGKDPAFDFGQHFGIELFDGETLSSWKEKAKTAGILPHLEEEQVTCCYAVADKFWMQDPDGNEWEFWVKTDEDGETLYSNTAASACCAPEATDIPEKSSCCAPEPVTTSCCS